MRDRATIVLSCAINPALAAADGDSRILAQRLGAAVAPDAAALALMPRGEYPSQRLLLKRAAAGAIVAARETHARVHGGAVPPHVAVPRFGRTDEARYRAAYDLHIERLASLEVGAMVRHLTRWITDGPVSWKARGPCGHVRRLSRRWSNYACMPGHRRTLDARNSPDRWAGW